MEAKNINREYYIDFLKFIGSLLLILAHVNAPNIIIQLRDFDVILMVLISGILGKKSIERSNSEKLKYLEFIKKRFSRLVIPTWVFLLFIYFILFSVGQPLDFLTMIKGLLFQRDSSIVGYVWVIWVYFSCAILLPLLIKIDFKKNFILIILFMIFFESMSNIDMLVGSRLLYYSFFTVVPYGLITLIGLNYEAFKKEDRWFLIIFTAILWFFLLIYYYFQNGQFIMTNTYKYPVRAYYLCYGLSISLLLIEIFRPIKSKVFRSKFIVFISKSSLWIYLWHILYINLFTYFFSIESWIIRFVLVLIFSVLTTVIQVNIISRLECKYGKNYYFKIFNNN